MHLIGTNMPSARFQDFANTGHSDLQEFKGPGLSRNSTPPLLKHQLSLTRQEMEAKSLNLNLQRNLTPTNNYAYKEK